MCWHLAHDDQNVRYLFLSFFLKYNTVASQFKALGCFHRIHNKVSYGLVFLDVQTNTSSESTK